MGKEKENTSRVNCTNDGKLALDEKINRKEMLMKYSQHEQLLFQKTTIEQHASWFCSLEHSKHCSRWCMHPTRWSRREKATDNYQHCLSLSWSTVDDDDDDEKKKRNDRLEKRLIKLLASHFFSQFILDQAWSADFYEACRQQENNNYSNSRIELKRWGRDAREREGEKDEEANRRYVKMKTRISLLSCSLPFSFPIISTSINPTDKTM